jgi:hypothetical protein
LERCKRAIHVRTGDRGTDGAISTWLQRHGVDVTPCADAFEACVYALAQPEPPPELALIGADWLAPDEVAVLGYLRETWPGIAIVVYGGTEATASFEASPATRVCRSGEALRRMLADTPDALLDVRRAAPQSPAPPDDGWRPQPKAAPPEVRHPGPGGLPLPRSTIQTHDPEMLASELARRSSQEGSGGTAGQRPPVSHEILTREELAALLADDEE